MMYVAGALEYERLSLDLYIECLPCIPGTRYDLCRLTSSSSSSSCLSAGGFKAVFVRGRFTFLGHGSEGRCTGDRGMEGGNLFAVHAEN